VQAGAQNRQAASALTPKAKVAALAMGDGAAAENVRFSLRKRRNDPGFAAKLAALRWSM